MVDFASVPVPAAKFIKQKVKKSYLDEAEMKKRFLKLYEAVEKKKMNSEDAIPIIRNSLAGSKRLLTEISDYKKTTRRFTVLHGLG